MHLQELVLIVISLIPLSAAKSEFVAVSTTASPPPRQRKSRQEHDNYYDKQDTCSALTKNTYLLEIIKLQNAQIGANLEKQTQFQQDAINSSIAELQKINTYVMTETQRELEEAKREIVANVITLLTNHLSNVCNLNQLRYTQVFIISEIQRILQEKLETSAAKFEETKQTIVGRLEGFEARATGIEGKIFDLEKILGETRTDILGKIQAMLDRIQQPSSHIEDLRQEIVESRELLKKVIRVPRNCREVQSLGNNVSGIYYIQPDLAPHLFRVFCDMKTQGGGWVYVMNRFDGSQNFFLNWTDYKNGFGNPNGEFWLGLEHVYELTGENPGELLVELVDWDNKTAHARYSSFSIGPEKEKYVLKLLGGYGGDAPDSLSYHLNMNFSTVDRSQNKGGYCANYFKGSWWYKDCFTVHLTGTYLKGDASRKAKLMGIHWNGFRDSNYSYSLKQVRMMVRPQSGDSALLPHEKTN
ncbi:hypothetical protein Zmor_008362 [Zophobas morio]|uniref:Fibrinogen C-terminal domain-containing protein n=1 Tax=Zophobas morio TaxID=2755281 RepID=A0AA38IVD0_9CUCU|nr:hypothetical protein Zmor_008362 [Zophobas morio]